MPRFEGEIELDGLTLQQYKAAMMIAGGKYIKDDQIAEKLGVKRTEFKKWKNMPNFRFKVLQLFDEITKDEVTYRTRRMNKILSPLYKEIKKRLKNGEHKDMRFVDLLRVMSQVHNEIRCDYRLIAKVVPAGQLGTKVADDDGYEGDSDIDGEDVLALARTSYGQSRLKAIEENSSKVVSINRKSRS